MKDVLMPKFGATMKTGTIDEWFVKVGDTVKKGDKLCEISSEKITNTLEAYEDGVIAEIIVEEGDEADIAEPIARIDNEA